jgi:hypothetical protein
VRDADGKLVFTVYPTLVQERAQLVLHESVAGQDSWLSIVDAGGRIVQQQPVGQQLELSLDMSGLASGMYWVRLYTGEQVYTARLVKLTN